MRPFGERREKPDFRFGPQISAIDNAQRRFAPRHKIQNRPDMFSGSKGGGDLIPQAQVFKGCFAIFACGHHSEIGDGEASARQGFGQGDAFFKAQCEGRGRACD